MTSGMRSASDAGSPRRNAGAIALADAFMVTTRPSASIRTVGSGKAAITSVMSPSPGCAAAGVVGAGAAAWRLRRLKYQAAASTAATAGIPIAALSSPRASGIAIAATAIAAISHES